MQQTGENEQGLRKIIDLARAISIVILLLNCYYYCHVAFRQWQLTAQISDKILINIAHTGLFKNLFTSKFISLAFLVISLFGARGRKNEKQSFKGAVIYILTGAVFYFSSSVMFYLHLAADITTICYIGLTVLGYVLILAGGTLLSRIIKLNNRRDIFNRNNQSFPQEERLLENPYSVHLPGEYMLNGEKRSMYINIVEGFRGVLLVASSGGGKSYFVILNFIKQLMAKRLCMFIYDYKFPELSEITYNEYLKSKGASRVPMQFYVLNFDNVELSHRCNPLDPSTMEDITDAAASARSIMFGLNKDWIKKKGEFFVESSISFVTCLIWFLAKYKSGKYCSLPHLIELAQVPYNKLFTVLGLEPQIQTRLKMFISAYMEGASEQLEGQMASANVGLSQLTSPNIYYVLSGNDFTLDINNPLQPKILCLGNNSQRAEAYSAVTSLYSETVSRLINQDGKEACVTFYDEFASLYLNIIPQISTGRSRKIITVLSIQDYSQLKMNYGKEQAEAIMNIPANIICGQAKGEVAKIVSESIGKILQERESVTINRTDTSVNKSYQLDFAVPVSKIANLSAGGFVGIVADNPQQKIELKAFDCEVINDHKTLEKEKQNYKRLQVVRKVSEQDKQNVLMQIKKDIDGLIGDSIEMIMNTPELQHLIIKKK